MNAAVYKAIAELEEIRKYKYINPLAFFDRLPLQEAFFVSEAPIRLLLGGNRSSKTTAGADTVIEYARDNAGARIWCAAETFEVSVSIQQRKIWELIPKNLIEYGRYDEVNGFSNRKLKLKNGTILMFKSYDQGVEAFASDDIDLVWLDEECPYNIYLETKMRLLDRNGRLIITMTSLKGMTELLEELFENYEIVKADYCRELDEDLPRIARKGDIDIFFLWTTENPHINQERVRRDMELMTRQEIKSRIFGIPINLAGRIYPQFSSDVHVIPYDDLPFGKSLTLYHVLDPHDAKPWAMIWAVVDQTNTIYTIDEYPNRPFNDILSDDNTYDDYVNIIKIKEDAIFDVFGCKCYKRIIDPNFGNKTIRIAERDGNNTVTTPKKILAKQGLKFIDGIDAIEAGHLKVRDLLRYKYIDGQMMITPRFYVADNCQNTIRHMLRYAHKDPNTKSGDIRNRPGLVEKYKHYPDLVRYLAMSNPKYIDKNRIWAANQGSMY